MKALVIEDNAANMKLVGTVLRKHGIAVMEACDADEGFRLAVEGGPDVVVLDINLPGADGLAVARALRLDERTKGVRIVALTAHAMEGDRERILEAGCDAYLSKPVDYKGLLEAVRGGDARG